MAVQHQGRLIGTVLALLALPPLVALAEATAFHLRNRSNGSLRSAGLKREYLVYVPARHDPSRPAPLVLSLHGGAGWPALQRDVSGWNRVADRHGFIVAYPAGLGRTGTRGWRSVDPGPGTDEDVRFIAALIDRLAATYNLDPARIYVNGLSNGGGMTFVLSCALADRIAAVGMVATAQMLPWSWCEDPRPMPVISFHGTADPLVPYEGGRTWIGPYDFPDIATWTARWARRNRCGGEPVDDAVAADVTRREYRGCAGAARVVLYTIHDGGHTWPGGLPLPDWFLGPTTSSVDASALMWAFFSEHRLRRQPGTAGTR